MKKKGKFIVIYGINGTGKSTQVKNTIDYLERKKIKVQYLKYPIYDLRPEGPFIDKYLRDEKFRKKNPQTTEQLQTKYAKNRKRFEGKLKNILAKGTWVVAEDYLGTGIAWGLTWGADLEYLEDINRNLLQPDLTILLHGKRFLTALEKGHRNESNEEKMSISKNFHRLLACRYDWKLIDSNQEIKEVSRDIQKQIRLLSK
jgi:dTMP kinase